MYFDMIKAIPFEVLRGGAEWKKMWGRGPQIKKKHGGGGLPNKICGGRWKNMPGGGGRKQYTGGGGISNGIAVMQLI